MIAETRRDWVRAEEGKMYRDREALWLASVRGMGLIMEVLAGLLAQLVQVLSSKQSL